MRAIDALEAIPANVTAISLGGSGTVALSPKRSMVLADLLIVGALAWLGLGLAWLLHRRRRALEGGRWEPRTRALGEGATSSS